MNKSLSLYNKTYIFPPGPILFIPLVNLLQVSQIWSIHEIFNIKMVVISASITSKAGKLLLSRQYRELNRNRIEGLLAAFQS